MRPIELRPYQVKIMNVIGNWLMNRPDRVPVFEAPTGSGKSVIIGKSCELLSQDGEAKVLILTHQKELVEQDAAKIRALCGEESVGIYCAGLGLKQVDRPFTVASIQSLAHCADDLPLFKLTVIDEAHRINNNNAGQYRRMLERLKEINPSMRVFGLTATPYRTGQGYLNEGKTAIFTDVVPTVSIRELVESGYLAPMVTVLPDARQETDGARIRAGDYVTKDLETLLDIDEANTRLAQEITARLNGDRLHWLIFCISVNHAHHIRDALRNLGVSCETVTGDMPTDERDDVLRRFKAGGFKALTNVDVLTTGFDYPDIDAVVMARPTMSTSLYVQMAGRGMRLKNHCSDCLLLDFAGNSEVHGEITDVHVLLGSRGRVDYECEPWECTHVLDNGHHCGTLNDIGHIRCSACGSIRQRQCPNPKCNHDVDWNLEVCPWCGTVMRQGRSALTKRAADMVGAKEPEQDTEWESVEISGWSWHARNSRAGSPMLVCRFAEKNLLALRQLNAYFSIGREDFFYNANRLLCEFVPELVGMISRPLELYEIKKLADALNERTKAPEAIEARRRKGFWEVRPVRRK